MIGHFPEQKIKNVTGLMKDELGWKIMTKFVGLRAKTYSYVIDDDSYEKKRETCKKRVPWKKKLNLKIIKTVWRQPNFRIK